MSNILVIHPKDKSTDFLKKIYAPILNKTVINGGITKIELKELIKSHDRVIMLGHGTANGLLAVGQFPKAGNYIIDWSMVDLLSLMKDTIYIWCHADQFVERYNLNGFYSGMFISEPSEALALGYYITNTKLIDDSNKSFASIVSNYINEPLNLLYQNVIQEYGIVAVNNPIAEFNLERLYLNRDIKKTNLICNTKFC